MVEKRRFSIGNLFKRTTPKPADRTIFNPGIQEKNSSYMITAPIVYHMGSQSVILRTCITQLKNEIFRKGYTWEQKFVVKLAYARRFLERYVNSSEQMFIDVLKELEDDLNIMDDAYLVMVKEYYLDSDSEVKMHRIKEIYRGDPVTMFIHSDELGRKGTEGYTCVRHREMFTTEMGQICEECQGHLHPIHYVNRVHGEEQYFIKGEVLHFSKYSPSRLYGLSPVLTLWNHITTLIAMENYINSSYTKARMPRGLLAVQTRNIDSMKSFWRGVKEKMEQDPHFIPVMGIEGEGGKGSVEWVNFMDSIKEMDYISVKEDLRDRISAFYGVSKIFQNDATASGGLNNEGMQILVTNRAVEMAQTVWNNYVFPFITVEFGITDWELKLPPSEEEDQVAEKRLREIEVSIAGQIKNLGFDVTMDDEGRFIFTKEQPEGQKGRGEGGGEEIDRDPYAGTDIDQSHLGEMMAQGDRPTKEEAGVPEKVKSEEGSKPQENPPAARTKPSMNVGPDKRFSGLPKEAGNQNVDKRTERRVG